ncbi:hypothetical protein [Pseudonocardia asaccharolytica]|uniref:Uncharacterized protein n=1 Tax=Pseudonocardia asaccharolytica DSM 44247 = NBRC 16224 TaxID=1123024 RepID=A0A511CV07_9PSEU|nr:hypothetical protein [Pseudonocardia asaccharolytica]GEL16402.1 hypothetical protein PA7_02390 [Pseudonocardia asaccharolytica DSM 44247 = NBRC 16224]
MLPLLEPHVTGCALEAARLTTGTRRLVLYEPGIGATTPPGFADRLAGLLAQGRREDVVTALCRDLLQMPAEHLALLISEPSWPGRVAAAHTVVREIRTHDGYRFDPERFAALRVPILLLADADGPADEAASTATLAARRRERVVVRLCSCRGGTPLSV